MLAMAAASRRVDGFAEMKLETGPPLPGPDPRAGECRKCDSGGLVAVLFQGSDLPYEFIAVLPGIAMSHRSRSG